MLTPGTVVDEKFEIITMLGQGATGVVYKARHIKFERKIALKILHPIEHTNNNATRFEREAAILSALKHRNVVTFHGYGLHNDSRYIAMELLEGESLEAKIQQSGRLPISTSIELMRQITDGMASAHRQGILHRDLKPTNVIVQTSDTETGGILAKVVDFGLARLNMLDAASNLNLTGEQLLAGSISYSSPEQCAGRQIDARADVYSLGCIMHHGLSGLPPFGGMHTNGSRKTLN